MNRDEILSWLLEEDPDRLEALWKLADDVRRRHVGNAVHLRGLVEFSNYCRSHCHYCGLRNDRITLARYRMTAEEIMAAAGEAVLRGYGAVVLQSGEDPELDAEWLAGVIRTIKRDTPLAVTLSCGERDEDELARWFEAGADRYYLRFETSDRFLWKTIHPLRAGGASHRLDILPRIKEIGYETGSGVMVGIPGQTWLSIAEDLEWFRKLDLDMIGCGPYVPHEQTPSGVFHSPSPRGAGEGQAPNSNLAACKVMALTRLICPDVNIPSTTALATLSQEDGYKLGLQRGANVLMVNLTPLEFRGFYEIYPAKAGILESSRMQRNRVESLLQDSGRVPGRGPGTSLKYEARRAAGAFRIAR